MTQLMCIISGQPNLGIQPPRGSRGPTGLPLSLSRQQHYMQWQYNYITVWLNIENNVFQNNVFCKSGVHNQGTNNTAYVYYTWSVQTGYTAAQGSTLTHRPVLDYRQRHYMQCQNKYITMCLNIQTTFSAMVTSITKDTNKTAYIHYTWPVQTSYTTTQGSTLTHSRPLFIDNGITCSVTTNI